MNIVDKMLESIGNGDVHKGDYILERIYSRLKVAREKHPKFEGPRCIISEMGEFIYAVDHESEDRAKDEALDIIVTCVRYILNEEN